MLHCGVEIMKFEQVEARPRCNAAPVGEENAVRVFSRRLTHWHARSVDVFVMQVDG